MKNFDKPICWICGNPIEYINVRVDGTIFCSECGATLSESNCPKINLEDATKRKFDVALPQKFPADLDDSCKELYIALNKLPGIVTVSSCCGHNVQPYRFWFTIDSLWAHGFLTLLRIIDPRYGCNDSWSICVEETDLSEAPVRFVLEAPVGSYESANILAYRLSESNLGLCNWLKACNNQLLNVLISLSAEEFDKLPTLSEVEIREALDRGRRDRIAADANERGKAIKSSRGR